MSALPSTRKVRQLRIFAFNGNAFVNPQYLTQLSGIAASFNKNFATFPLIPAGTKLSTTEEETLAALRRNASDPGARERLKKCLVGAYFGKQTYDNKDLCSTDRELVNKIKDSQVLTAALVNLTTVFLNPDATGPDIAIMSATLTGPGPQDLTVVEYAQGPEEVAKYITDGGPKPDVICKSYGFGSTRFTDYGGDNAAGEGKSLYIEKSNYVFKANENDKSKLEEMTEKNKYLPQTFGKKDEINNLIYAND